MKATAPNTMLTDANRQKILYCPTKGIHGCISMILLGGTAAAMPYVRLIFSSLFMKMIRRDTVV